MTELSKQVEMLRDGLTNLLESRYENGQTYVYWRNEADSLLHNLPVKVYLKVGSKFVSIEEAKK